jgi:hypothetical protein
MSLNEKNAHPRDALIEFDAGPHKYTCAGEGGYTSVTTWLHTHFQPFDADAIIKKMKLTNPKCKYYGKTPEEIKAGWDHTRDEAAAAGTAMHAAIEEFWLGMGTGGNPPGPPDLGQIEPEGRTQGADAESGCISIEINAASALSVRPSPAGGSGGAPPPQFTAFVRAHPQLKPYRTEWMIFDEDVRLAGSIDFVTENPDGTLTIYDWKRCKEIKKTNSFGDFAITDCIAHLPDTNYWHYALQLNTYKTILERKYDKKITGLFLVGLHPNLPSYQMFTVPFMVQEMTALFTGLLAPVQG